jgi:hypothetical protein
MTNASVLNRDAMIDRALDGHSVLFWLVGLVAVGIIFIGARFLVVPLPASAAFGVPAEGTPTLAYQWAKGTRDIVSGLLVIALVWSGAGRRVLAVFMAVAALIPLGDLINVYANVGTHNPMALAIHGGTAASMVALAWGLSRR